MDIPSIAATPVPNADHSLVTVATFDTMPDAHIALGKLGAAGIDAYLADENLVQTDWLYAAAVGGIKLQVRQIDRQAAEAELARDYSQPD